MSPDAPAFFVDYELCPSDTGAPRVSFAFRIGEHVLGDQDVELDARTMLGCVHSLLRHEGDRRDEALARTPLADLVPRLEVGVLLYSDPGMDAGRDWKRFLRFVALPPECATFFGWSVFLVEDSQRARLVWRDPRRSELGEAWLEHGELEAALRSFCAELALRIEGRQSLAPKSGERVKTNAAPLAAPISRRAGER
jgi:hypothetical protein